MMMIRGAPVAAPAPFLPWPSCIEPPWRSSAPRRRPPPLGEREQSIREPLDPRPFSSGIELGHHPPGPHGHLPNARASRRGDRPAPTLREILAAPAGGTRRRPVSL